MSHLIKIYMLFANSAIFVSGTERVNGVSCQILTIKYLEQIKTKQKTSEKTVQYKLDKTSNLICICYESFLEIVCCQSNISLFGGQL